MKKIVKMLLLAAVFTLALSVSAFAASGTEAGICDIAVEDEFKTVVTLTPMTGGNAPVAVTEPNAGGVYANTERVSVTFSNAKEAKYYLVVAQTGGEYPTADNVAYINQVTADDTSVVFDVYPNAPKSGQTYSIYISSNDGMAYTKVASFSYYAPYKLGDTNSDDKIQAVDALRVLRHVAKQITLTPSQALAADVNGDTKIQAVDALRILRYVAKQINSFD